MKFNKLITSIGLTVGSVLFVSNSAQAASFTSNVSKSESDYTTKDILLQSIEQKDKNGIVQTFSNFSFVERVGTFSNDKYTGGNSGAASTDRGDNASAPVISNEDPTEVQLAKYLGNNNLNNIVDTEDRGTFMMDVFFDSFIEEDNSGLDNLFFWERGMNSDLSVQAIDDQGNIIGNAIKLLRKEQQNAGYQINTKEIGGNQKVGSWGVSLEQLGVTNLSGIQIYADKSFNGPDFKVIARKSSSSPKFAQAAKVPEPGTIIGLGTVAALAFFRRRKSM
ncbi:MAG: PEP-CTERM sorting domain-containing protein [Rivularia sp. T60_A2020_040]|nr:PEP-CTERM sorting domain-containing protein [Rivularia sp. T60_A2020_040]